MAHLRILFWNAEGLTRHKVGLLRLLLREQYVDVVLLSETHLRGADPLKIPNYLVYRKDELSDSGRAFRGLAVLVRRRLVHQPLPQLAGLQSIYALGVEICVNGNPTRVFAVYKPPAARLVMADVHALLDSPLPTIVAGDWNCKHTGWNSTHICPNGRRLFDDAERRGYVVLGPETPTHYPHNPAHLPDVIDLAVAQGSLSTPTLEVLDEHTGSDHQPVLLILPDQPTRTLLRPPRSKHDWEAFGRYMVDNTPMRPVSTPADVDLLADEFTSVTQQALQHATVAAPTRGAAPATPPHILKMLAEKRRLRKQWQGTRCPAMKSRLNALAEKISVALETVATESWQRTIDSAGEDWNGIHRLCRQLSGKPAPVRPLLASDGTPRYRAEDRAEIFAECLESQFRPNPGPDQHAEEVAQHLAQYFSTPIAPDEDPIVFSPGQVQRAVLKTKLRKAPGPDAISNESLRHLPPRSIAAVTRLFNGIMRTGHFPTSWKLGRVIMLPKPGKNILKPESYRPITLLPTISKVFEKLLLRHMIPHIMPREEQFGFRAEHSTTLQLARVLHDMTAALNKRETTVAVLLDMEKAFDRVWHPGLVYKLSTSTTPRRVVKTVATFLENRRFQVAVESALSQARTIAAGVPQGSCLSPFCYARYTDDIPVEEGARLALYADDAAFFTVSLNVRHAVRKMQRSLDALPAWLAKWRLTVNVGKTQAIVVGRRLAPSNRLHLHGQDIDWSPKVKYLGVTIDRQLSMKAHIDTVVASARAARALLFPVLRSRLPLRTKLGVYKAYIRTRLTYAAPAWYALASQSQRQRLHAQQSLSLRTIADAPRYVRNATIQRDLKIESLDAFIGSLATRMFGRADESSFRHLRELAPYHARPPDLKSFPRDLVVVQVDEENQMA